jgi:hypothetical protein
LSWLAREDGAFSGKFMGKTSQAISGIEIKSVLAAKLPWG